MRLGKKINMKQRIKNLNWTHHLDLSSDAMKSVSFLRDNPCSAVERRWLKGTSCDVSATAFDAIVVKSEETTFNCRSVIYEGILIELELEMEL